MPAQLGVKPKGYAARLRPAPRALAEKGHCFIFMFLTRENAARWRICRCLQTKKRAAGFLPFRKLNYFHMCHRNQLLAAGPLQLFVFTPLRCSIYQLLPALRAGKAQNPCAGRHWGPQKVAPPIPDVCATRESSPRAPPCSRPRGFAARWWQRPCPPPHRAVEPRWALGHGFQSGSTRLRRRLQSSF